MKGEGEREEEREREGSMVHKKQNFVRMLIDVQLF